MLGCPALSKYSVAVAIPRTLLRNALLTSCPFSAPFSIANSNGGNYAEEEGTGDYKQPADEKGNIGIGERKDPRDW